MLSLNLNPVVDELSGDLSRTGAVIERATKRALRNTLRWLERQLIKDMADVANMPQKTIRQYRRVHINLEGMTGEAWVGLNPLPLHESGAVKWNRQAEGASVNGKTYAGSFYKAVYGDTRKVWIRTSRNQQEGHATYHRKRRYRAFSGEVGSSRFPVEMLGVPLEDVEDEMDGALEGQAVERFYRSLSQELRSAQSGY